MKAEGRSASDILSTLGLGVRDLRVIGFGAAEAMRVCGCTTVSALTTDNNNNNNKCLNLIMINKLNSAEFIHNKADVIPVDTTSEYEYCDV